MNKRINIFSIIVMCSICFSACGHRPQKQKLKALVIDKPTYNIYIENSGSMDGYVKNGGTPFQNTVYGFLNDIHDNKLDKLMNLNFIINVKVAKQPFDIQNYILKLTPIQFHSIRGSIRSSEISVMFKKVLENTNQDNVNIWISDCVFTPNQGNNPNSYLGFEKTSIKSTFKNLLGKGDYTTVVLQLMSKYDGIYCGYHITQDRPYYIWIVGNEKFIKSLFEKTPLNSFEGGGVKNFYSLSNNSDPIKYIILGAPNYQLSTSSPKTKIINAKPIQVGPNIGKFQFSIGLNLKGNMIGIKDSYVLDPNNFNITSSSKYTIEIKRNISGKGSYTHILKLTTLQLKADDIKISLKNNLPSWINEINSINAGPLTLNDKFKTFGIKTLIEGVSEAYSKKSIFEINISIKLN